MQRLTLSAICLSLAVAVLGCNTFPWARNTGNTGGTPESNAVFAKREPQAQELVAYLNDNARRVPAAMSKDVTMDYRQGTDTPIGLNAMLACSRPRNFRLRGKVAGQEQIDIGSNDDEFWYWIARATPPYVAHCTYKEMNTGKVWMPFPFNPDMVVCALNMAEYNPNAHYEVRVNNRDNVIELIEPMKSLQGQDIFRVTYFNRGEVTANRPRVLAYALKDQKGKDVCTATMLEVQTTKEGAVLPVRVKLVFFGEKPADRGELTLRFYDLTPTRFDAERVATLFSRKDLGHLQGFNLASGRPDQPSGTSMSIQRTSGVLPR